MFDEETGLYYLRSRYYISEKARFINADTVLGAIGYLLTHNSYTYCINAPILRTDDTGKISTWATLINQFQNAITIAIHSVATRMNPNPKAEIVTVDVLINNLRTMADKKTNVSSLNDSGCGMYIRAGIVGRLNRHSHDVYEAGMTSMFRNNMVLQGSIEDIGGPNGLIPGMILGTASSEEGKISHGGVYYGLYDFGNGLEHAVYSFNTAKNRGNLRPFSDQHWVYYGWHQGVILE